MVTIEVCALVGFTGTARVERLGALDAILLDRACRIGAAAVALVELHPTELVVQRGRAIGETCAFRLPREGRLRSRIERVRAGPRARARHLGEGRAGLVVGNVRLARVGEERQDGGDALGRGGAAGRNGNEKSGGRSGTSLNYTMRMGLLHQMVVDCAQHETLAGFFTYRRARGRRVPSQVRCSTTAARNARATCTRASYLYRRRTG